MRLVDGPTFLSTIETVICLSTEPMVPAPLGLSGLCRRRCVRSGADVLAAAVVGTGLIWRAPCWSPQHDEAQEAAARLKVACQLLSKPSDGIRGDWPIHPVMLLLCGTFGCLECVLY